MADQKQETIIVKLRGKEATCEGLTARIIAYLADNQMFFNDPRTTGNIVLSLKAGDLQIKNDIVAQL